MYLIWLKMLHGLKLYMVRNFNLLQMPKFPIFIYLHLKSNLYVSIHDLIHVLFIMEIIRPYSLETKLT